MNLSTLYYEKEYLVENIFKLRNNIFYNNLCSKKVTFNNKVSVILIPNIKSSLTNDEIHKLWYNNEDINYMRSAFINEINVISNTKCLSFRDSVKIWKSNNSHYYSSST